MSFLHLSLPQLISAAGYIGIFCMLFAESGLFFGIVFPGDSLLFTAGLLASQGLLNIWILAPLCALAAMLGDSFGYFTGLRLGPRLFSREDSRFFHRKYLEQTAAFFAQHGPQTIVLARFVPIVRTFAPVLAGAGRMRYSTFLAYNFLGAALWGAGLTLLGFSLGSAVPAAAHYLTPIAILIMVVSTLPVILKARHLSRRS